MMFNFIKSIFVKAYRAAKSLLKKVFTSAINIFIGELKDFAMNIVKNLENADLSNDSKREAAFKLISDEAKSRGLYYKNNWINILIHIALEAVRLEF